MGTKETPPKTAAVGQVAPTWSLPIASGGMLSSADLKDENVLLYISAGTGCGPCVTQVGEIERFPDRLKELNVRLVPIMPDEPSQVVEAAATFKITTPILADTDLKVSKAFDTITAGGHMGGLPNHTFILVDRKGVVRWRKDYPSMQAGAQEVFGEIEAALKA